MRALDAGLNEGHDDMGLPDEYAVCFAAPRVTIGSGASQIDASLSDHLPSVTEVATQIDPSRSQHTLSAMPAGTLVVSLNGGRLRMPGKPSNNKGTHGIPWQFNFKSNPVGRDYLLTDLLVYHCRDASVALTAGSASTTLGAGERLWIVNVPTEKQDDKDTTDVIAHAHEWFSLVSPSLPGSPDDVSVRAKKRYTRDKSTRSRFVHPCADPRTISRKYFPPDTDPCFLVRA
jgi:hypothetical protein